MPNHLALALVPVLVLLRASAGEGGDGCLNLDGLGMGMAALGDIDGDGHDDFALGAPKQLVSRERVGDADRSLGRVLLISGRTMEPLWDRAAEGAVYFGQLLEAVDDIDGDGATDLVVLSTRCLSALSGADGALLWEVACGELPFVTRVPDADGDARADIAVVEFAEGFGARLPTSIPGRLCTSGMRVRLLSGVSGETLWTRVAAEHEAFNGPMLGVGDRDGDGRGDLVCMVGKIENGIVDSFVAMLLSGIDGSQSEFERVPFDVGGTSHFPSPNPVATASGSSTRKPGIAASAMGKVWLCVEGQWDGSIVIDAPDEHPRFGYALACVHDLDGDGASDLLVTAKMELEERNPGGRVWAFSGRSGGELPVWRIDGDRLLPLDSGGYGFGARVAALGDVNADGTPDFGVAAVDDVLGSRSPGTVLVFSGRDRTVLAVIR